MVVVGPEDPLVKGIYDYFQNRPELKHIAVIGPSANGAQLEGSKEFAKGFMMRHQIPTARYKSITAENLEEGLAFLETLEAPYVLKADGLCAVWLDERETLAAGHDALYFRRKCKNFIGTEKPPW